MDTLKYLGAAVEGKNFFESHRDDDENIPDADSDGMVQYYNLGSQSVMTHPDYLKCLPYLNSFASLARIKYHSIAEKQKLGAYDKALWELVVSNLYKLGFAQYTQTDFTYSETQTSAEFNSQLLKLIMDIAASSALPASVVTSIADFMSSIGGTIGFNWTDKQKNYSTSTLSTCHELVGNAVASVYVPKLRYYNVQLTARQVDITTSCGSAHRIEYEFKYLYMASIWNYQYLFSPEGAKTLKIINDTISGVNEKAASESQNFFGNNDLPSSSPALVGDLPQFPYYARISGRWIPTGDFFSPENH